MTDPKHDSTSDTDARADSADEARNASDAGRSTDDSPVPGDDPRVAADSGSAMEQQLAEQRDKYLRLAAEFDNYRKRTSRERLEAHSRGQAELVKQLLEGLDDLGRFAHLDPTTVDSATVVQGADMVEKKLLKVLQAAGLQLVNPIDQTFDPTLHEAVSTEPALSPEDDDVVSRVYQQGYVFNGQLLRPARVVVKQWNG